MSDIDLKAIRARAEAATEGPWWAWDRGVGYEIAVGPEVDERGRPARKLPAGDRTDIGRQADAEFIAHAREDIPALLAEIDQLNGELDDRDSAVGSLHADLDFQTKAAFDNQAEANRLRRIVEVVTDLTRSTDGDDIDPDFEIPVGEIQRALRDTGTTP